MVIHHLKAAQELMIDLYDPDKSPTFEGRDNVRPLTGVVQATHDYLDGLFNDLYCPQAFGVILAMSPDLLYAQVTEMKEQRDGKRAPDSDGEGQGPAGQPAQGPL